MKLSKLRQSCHGPVIKDPRFAFMHSDPRFQRVLRNKLKIPIDSRFRHMFTDRSFLDPVGVDKRGRPRRKEERHSLHHYYRVDDTPDETHDQKTVQSKLLPESGGVVASAGKVSEVSDSSHQEESERWIGRVRGTEQVVNALSEVKLKRKLKSRQAESIEKQGFSGKQSQGRKDVLSTVDNASTEHGELSDELEDPESSKQANNLGVLYDDKLDTEDSSSSSPCGSSSSEDESDEDSELSSEKQEQEQEQKVPITDKETRRLAVVNMDWNHIKAVDLLVLMNSFVRKGGHIVSVSVYPSEFGLKQLREEELHGPQLHECSGDDEDSADDEIEMERLRQYEKARLRYYYAVVECDSCVTADILYKSCDGIEFERTSNILDVRFIPDDMEFKHAPRDVATEVPVDYEAPQFVTQALQHSRVKLTWDDDEPVRAKALHKKFNAEQLNEMDFKAYLASDEETEGSEYEETGYQNGDFVNNLTTSMAHEKQGERELEKMNLRNKYSSFLLGSGDNMGVNEIESDKEMEITFHGGLDELSKRLMEKTKHRDDETVWEAYLRKKKEKRKERKKSQGRNLDIETQDPASSDLQTDSVDEAFLDNSEGNCDPFFDTTDEAHTNDMIDTKRDTKMYHKPVLGLEKKLQRKNFEQERNAESKIRAELELLFADNQDMDNVVKGYNLKKKRFKGKGREIGKVEEKFSTVDYNDPRFSALFTSHHFAVDPTNPNFQRSAGHFHSLVEKQKKHLQQIHQSKYDPSTEMPRDDINDSRGFNLNKRKLELSSLVRSLKRKVGAKD
eukprot:c28023_g4_i2 orf=345-2711(-)